MKNVFIGWLIFAPVCFADGPALKSPAPVSWLPPGNPESAPVNGESAARVTVLVEAS